MKQAYQLTTDEIMQANGLTELTTGLSAHEAQQRLAKDGKNILALA